MWFICASIVINKQTIFPTRWVLWQIKFTKFGFDRGSALGPNGSSRRSPNSLVGWRGDPMPIPYAYNVSFYHKNCSPASDIKDANKPFFVLGSVILSGMPIPQWLIADRGQNFLTSASTRKWTSLYVQYSYGYFCSGSWILLVYCSAW